MQGASDPGNIPPKVPQFQQNVPQVPQGPPSLSPEEKSRLAVIETRFSDFISTNETETNEGKIVKNCDQLLADFANPEQFSDPAINQKISEFLDNVSTLRGYAIQIKNDKETMKQYEEKAKQGTVIFFDDYRDVQSRILLNGTKIGDCFGNMRLIDTELMFDAKLGDKTQ